MKKLFAAFLAVVVVIAMTSSVALAESPKYVAKTLTISAGDTNATEYISLVTDGSEEFRSLDRVFAYHSSGYGTGTVSFAIEDSGTLTEIANSGAVMMNKISYANHPKYGFVTGTTVNVVTGGLVITKLNVATNMEPYTVRLLRINASQAIQSTDDVYKFGIYAK